MSVINEMIYNSFETVKHVCCQHKGCDGCPFYREDEKDLKKCMVCIPPEYWDCEKIQTEVYHQRWG